MDQYAQELHKLFYEAYPRVKQSSIHAEEFGWSVLAYQFTASLLPNLHFKVAGVDSTLEQLLVKACFEETKLRDLPRDPSDSKQLKS